MAAPSAVLATAPPSSLATLIKLASNIIASPDEPKYRTVKRSNKTIASKFLSHADKGMAWLAALGFKGEGDELVTSITASELKIVHDALTAAIFAQRVTRVCGAFGWVVHGLALEFGSGARAGAFVENDGQRMDLADDGGLVRRGGHVQQLQPGERIVAVNGRHSTMGYLCGAVSLVLSSGRELAFKGENSDVFGGSFEYVVPPDDEIADVQFADGRCTGILLRSQVRASASTAGTTGTADLAPPPAAPKGPPPRVLHSVRELLQWDATSSPEPARTRSPTAPTAPLPARPRVLHCHDCRGGYNECADGTYLRCFRGWDAIDVFCYFGHHRISMPPAAWVEACHARGVPCLGTIITEGGGEAAADQADLLSSVDVCVEKLCDLCEHYQFDGWLVNFESAVQGGRAQMAAVSELLATLTICLKQRVGEQALVIYYDALDSDGNIR